MNERHQNRARTAAGMLEIAQQRMVSEYPFHARFIAAWQLHATTAIRTVGVTVQGGAIILFFNPDFVVTCSFPQLMGVLHHEVDHLLFEHVFIDRSRFPDQQALTVAEEVTANEWVREPLPGSPILLSQFPQLPANEDTYTRYTRLAGESAGIGFEPDLYRKRGLLHQKVPSEGLNSPAVAPKLPPLSLVPDHPETLDDHTIWDDALMSGPVGHMAVRVLIREAASSLLPEQWQSLSPAIRNRIDDICRGDTPGSIVESLATSGTGRLNQTTGDSYTHALEP